MVKGENININLNKWNEILPHLKETFIYDEKLGIIYWNKNKHIAGTMHNGYIRIRFKGKNLPAHIIAWILFYNKIPEGELDHINHNRSDNRIVNLREVSKRVNQKNRTKTVHSNYYGVSKTQSGKWQTHCYKNKKLIYLGVYDDEIYAKTIVENYDKGLIDDKYIETLKQNKPTQRLKFRENKYFGTTYNKSKNKWEAQLVVDKKRYYLGSFDDREEAAKAVKNKEKELLNGEK